MANDVRKIVSENLNGFQDDLLEYIITAVDDMTVEERRSVNVLKELIVPFLLDSG